MRESPSPELQQLEARGLVKRCALLFTGLKRESLDLLTKLDEQAHDGDNVLCSLHTLLGASGPSTESFSCRAVLIQPIRTWVVHSGSTPITETKKGF